MLTNPAVGFQQHILTPESKKKKGIANIQIQSSKLHTACPLTQLTSIICTWCGAKIRVKAVNELNHTVPKSPSQNLPHQPHQHVDKCPTASPFHINVKLPGI